MVVGVQDLLLHSEAFGLGEGELLFGGGVVEEVAGEVQFSHGRDLC